jgi:hypothetical protein
VAAGQGSGRQARTVTPLGTQWSARSDVGRGMARGGMSAIGSGARTRPVKGVDVGWTTAESPAAGYGAGRDRMTSVLRACEKIGLQISHSKLKNHKPLVYKAYYLFAVWNLLI